MHFGGQAPLPHTLPVIKGVEEHEKGAREVIIII